MVVGAVALSLTPGAASAWSYPEAPSGHLILGGSYQVDFWYPWGKAGFRVGGQGISRGLVIGGFGSAYHGLGTTWIDGRFFVGGTVELPGGVDLRIAGEVGAAVDLSGVSYVNTAAPLVAARWTFLAPPGAYEPVDAPRAGLTLGVGVLVYPCFDHTCAPVWPTAEIGFTCEFGPRPRAGALPWRRADPFSPL